MKFKRFYIKRHDDKYNSPRLRFEWATARCDQHLSIGLCPNIYKVRRGTISDYIIIKFLFIRIHYGASAWRLVEKPKKKDQPQ